MDIGIFNKAYLYLNYGKKSIIIENKYTLNNRIDSCILKQALNNIIERFHYFKLKPVIDKNGDIDFIINNAEIDVYELDDKIYQLGTKETNGYMFRVVFKDNNIYIKLSHAIADARGALLFGLSLIYEYLKLMGISCNLDGEIITNDTPIAQNEIDTFKIDDMYKYFNTEYENKTVMLWNAEEFSSLIHRLECTPVSLITAIIGNAIYNNYDVKDKKVLVSIPVDLRPFFQSKSQANFITGIKLNYKEEYSILPINEQVTKIKNNLQEQLNITNFKTKIFETEQFFKKIIYEQKNIDEKNLSNKLENIMQSPDSTFMLSNIGIINIPKQMQSYLIYYECTTSNTTLSTIYTIMTIGNVGKLVITQNDNSDKIINEIKKFFIENRINIEIKNYGRIRMDVIDPYTFDNISSKSIEKKLKK